MCGYLKFLWRRGVEAICVRRLSVLSAGKGMRREGTLYAKPANLAHWVGGGNN